MQSQPRSTWIDDSQQNRAIGRDGITQEHGDGAVVDRSTNQTVVEYAVQTMIKKGASPRAAARSTAKKFSGFENMFFGPGVTTIDAAVLERALLDRLADVVVSGMSKLKPGFEHYALDGVIQQFNQKPSVRPALKLRVIERLGQDPFTADDRFS